MAERFLDDDPLPGLVVDLPAAREPAFAETRDDRLERLGRRREVEHSVAGGAVLRVDLLEPGGKLLVGLGRAVVVGAVVVDGRREPLPRLLVDRLDARKLVDRIAGLL